MIFVLEEVGGGSDICEESYINPFWEVRPPPPPPPPHKKRTLPYSFGVKIYSKQNAAYENENRDVFKANN